MTVTASSAPPADLVLAVATADGAATAGEDYTALAADAMVTISQGMTQAIISIPITDDAIVESAEDFTVTVSSPILGGDDPGDQVELTKATARVTIESDASDTAIGVSLADITVAENVSGGTAEVTVMASSALPADLVLAVATADDEATAGDDSRALAADAMVTISQGMTQAIISIPIMDDTIAEAAEDFTVTVSSPTLGGNDPGAQVELSKATATVTITDNDVALTLSPATLSVAEGATATLTVTATPAPTTDLALSVATAAAATNGATADTDYTAPANTVTIPAGTGGTATVDIEIPIIDDTAAEVAEAFTVTISSSDSRANITAPTATVTIMSNDPGAGSLADPRVIDASAQNNDGDNNAATLSVTVPFQEESGIYSYRISNLPAGTYVVGRAANPVFSGGDVSYRLTINKELITSSSTGLPKTFASGEGRVDFNLPNILENGDIYFAIFSVSDRKFIGAPDGNPPTSGMIVISIAPARPSSLANPLSISTQLNEDDDDNPATISVTVPFQGASGIYSYHISNLPAGNYVVTRKANPVFSGGGSATYSLVAHTMLIASATDGVSTSFSSGASSDMAININNIGVSGLYFAFFDSSTPGKFIGPPENSAPTSGMVVISIAPSS